MKKFVSLISILTIITSFSLPMIVMAQLQPITTCPIRSSFSLLLAWSTATVPPTPQSGIIYFAPAPNGTTAWPTNDVLAVNTATTAYNTAKGLPCVIDMISVIVNWMTALISLAVVLMVIWAAFDYLTSAGDEKKMGSAKKKIMYAVIAVVILLLSRMVVPIIKSIVGA